MTPQAAVTESVGSSRHSIVGRIAEEVSVVEEGLRQEFPQEFGSKPASEPAGCGVVVVIPDAGGQCDLVLRFSDAIVLSALSPSIAELVASLSPGDTVECDFPDGSVRVGFTETPWDTAEKFQKALDSNSTSAEDPATVVIKVYSLADGGGWMKKYNQFLAMIR